MKLQMIYIRNITANVVEFAPMFVHHLGMAIRDFGDQCRNKDTPLGKHPDEYELYHHGEWDDVDAVYTPLPRPKQLAAGINYAGN